MKHSREPLSLDFATKYIGGSGFGARILYDEVPAGVDPLGQENVIIIGQGALSGTPFAAGRYDLISKSPLTGIYARSNGGGFFGPELKYAGYDLIVIRGKAERPVYLWIDDEYVEIKDASHLWGKDTWATQRIIQEELDDPDIQVLKIGPGGENMSYQAAVIGNLGRAAGKVAIGAVWGAKNLKAVAVRGSGRLKLAEPERFIELCEAFSRRVKDDPLYPIHSTWGTMGWVGEPKVGKGLSPSHPLHHNNFVAHYVKNTACFGCLLHCGQFYDVKSGKYKGAGQEMIEGGPRGRLARIQVKDPAFALHYNNLCDRLSVNVSRLAEALLWAMSLYEQRVLTKEDTDGLELTWGNEEVILKVLHQVAYREGFGGMLHDFPLRTGEKFGKSKEYNPGHIKGNYSPIGMTGGMDYIGGAMSHSVSVRGADHLTGSQEMTQLNYHLDKEVLMRVGKEKYDDPGAYLEPSIPNPKQALHLYDRENVFSLCDMTGTCKFASEMPLLDKGIHLADFAELLSAATGIDFSIDDMNRAADREVLLARAFNAREGIRRIDDYPYPFYYRLKNGKEHPLVDYSKFQFSLEDYDKVLDEYYRLRGCDLATGIPTREKLESLGMKDVADDLARHSILPSQ